ncbi:hypothetical protein BJ993_001232 [Nocardioides aromaticivorans]|uniref:Uncharacterized protein n=1 Tax=Nocardioides aromaticivorans TaxID=200618 RepID=A0A7Y9ZEW1_9ACTN|nr:hypothetical protein [Nocardioides aromaticivorans]NYI44152.1 hypothetical protein [Nocardioides aromaticivorans]QSR28103.1 hypothetical protein CFH99_21005 [Nocardioides aromaticivorans]
MSRRPGLLVVLLLPLVALLLPAAAAQAAVRWDVSDYRCASEPGMQICAVKQKARYGGAWHYRSRVSVTPSAGHWAQPLTLRQRSPGASVDRPACGASACPRSTARWVGPWRASSARMVDGWVVQTDRGLRQFALASSVRTGVAEARAAVTCAETAAGRACVRLDVQQVRDRVEAALIAVVYPDPGQYFEFRRSTVALGGTGSGSNECPACEHWTTKTVAGVGGAGASPIPWPQDDGWTPDGGPIDAELELASSAGPVVLQLTWPAG